MDGPSAIEHHDELIERAAGARYVLLGEASHGSDEFYRERAAITERLIAEEHFTAVAIEGDWPAAHRVNRWVRGAGADASAEQALGDFRRFPSWMWRNEAVCEFATWLRSHNDARAPGEQQAGIYGLDLYSPRTSMEAVVSHLREIDPAAAQRARERYGCFDHFGRDPQVYALQAGIAGEESCERQVVEQLIELRERAAALAVRDDDSDGRFYAEQNARLVVNAERYYRALFRGGAESWNVRDAHMAETLDELVAHLERTSGPAKVVVWAHNSHLGDARATETAREGERNLGRLVRERAATDVLIVGFTTYAGTVTAASDWGGPPLRRRVRPALDGSWEELLHARGAARLVLDTAQLPGERLQRAIGVIYRPETERVSHYLRARIAEQFDVVVHIDQTHALVPLEATGEWHAGELPETHPHGI